MTGGTFLVVGSAACVWSDLEKFGDQAASVIAVNRMIVDYPGKLWGAASFHEDLAAAWKRESQRPVTLYCPTAANGVEVVVPHGNDRWHGTSALYAVQIALEFGKADRVVLAGCPLDDSDHIYQTSNLREYLEEYRAGWVAMLPVIRGIVTSLSGWTRELLGAPFPI